MNIKVYTLNVFAKTPKGGNPAGVVLEVDKLSENIMKIIAKKVGFSETAFVMQPYNADFKIRYFTAVDEVDLCGHATIATFYLLKEKGLAKEGKYKFETKAGILDIEIKKNEVFMTQNLPEFSEIIDKKEIAESLNITEDAIDKELPAQIVSTGLRDILVPIKDLKTLLTIKPNFKKVSEISKKYGVIGYHLFTTETKFGSTAHCRNFAPLYDIPEESATGTSNGALACYLFRHGKIKKTNNLVFEQGYSMQKPSEILVRLDTKNNEVKKVSVGGTAIIKKEKEIDI